jgi:hypothetical protein
VEALVDPKAVNDWALGIGSAGVVGIALGALSYMVKDYFTRRRNGNGSSKSDDAAAVAQAVVAAVEHPGGNGKGHLEASMAVVKTLCEQTQVGMHNLSENQLRGNILLESMVRKTDEQTSVMRDVLAALRKE